MKERILKYFLTAAVLVLSLTALTHVYLLGVGIASDQYFTFWLPVLVVGLLVFYAALTFKSKFPLILILIFALTFHLIQFVRQPPDMVWNPDAIYALQLVNHVNKAGEWTFGYGTGQALAYSYYPLFYVFQWALSSIPAIPSTLTIKYSMAFLNLLTLFTFYLLIKALFDLDVRSKNLVILMFSLGPMFHAVDSYAHAESYAIIFYPLILFYALKEANPRESSRLSKAAIVILVLVTLSMSHHWSSYLTALSLVVPTLGLYVVSTRPSRIRSYILVLSLILPAAWLSFVASSVLQTHIWSALQILSNIAFVNRAVGYSYSTYGSSLTYYPSELSSQLSLLRILAFSALTLIGVASSVIPWCSRKKENRMYFVALLLLLSSFAFLLLFGIDWTKTSSPDIRERVVEFAFFPISFFSALGLDILWKNAKTISRKMPFRNLTLMRLTRLALILMLVIVFVPATIFSSFPRFMYDTTYQPLLSVEFPVAPVQQYALGLWVRSNVNASAKTIFTGSISAQRYIVGYGLFPGTFTNSLFNTSRSQLNSSFSIAYVVNTYNLQLPDSLGRKLNFSSIQFLNDNLNKAYDNGVIFLYETP